MPIKKHWTQTIAGKRKQSNLQKARWERHRATQAQRDEVTSTTNGVGQDMEALNTIAEAMKKLSPEGLKYLKQRIV